MVLPSFRTRLLELSTFTVCRSSKTSINLLGLPTCPRIMKLVALLVMAWPLAIVAAPIEGELLKKDAAADAEPEPAPADYGSYGSYGKYSSYGTYPKLPGGYGTYKSYRRDAEEAPNEDLAKKEAEPEPAPADYGDYGKYGKYSSYGTYPKLPDGYGTYTSYRRNAEEAPVE